ncbi:MAG: competence protein ComK [Bacillus sp. (in: Bacteria)]|nr:competence protein ComK [Bacillus sp. (in: firmicutes)]
MKKTIALIPCLHPNFGTVVYETERTIYVKEACMDILDNSCMDGGASYIGRKSVIVRDLNYIQKTIVMIDRHKKLYIFPTHSQENVLCCWIVSGQVLQVNALNGNPKVSEIKFKGGRVIVLPVSKRIIDGQLFRAYSCQIRYSNS